MSALPIPEPLLAPEVGGHLGLAPAVGVTITPEHDAWFAPQATPTSALPDATAWVTSMAQAVAEALSGSRAATQLLRWMDPDIHDRIARRARVAARTRSHVQPARVRTVRVCHPADGVVEAAAVLQLNGRVRAMAIRLVGRDGRWVITEFELG